jgi:hypothetical protein
MLPFLIDWHLAIVNMANVVDGIVDVEENLQNINKKDFSMEKKWAIVAKCNLFMYPGDIRLPFGALGAVCE